MILAEPIPIHTVDRISARIQVLMSPRRDTILPQSRPLPPEEASPCAVRVARVVITVMFTLPVESFKNGICESADRSFQTGNSRCCQCLLVEHRAIQSSVEIAMQFVVSERGV